MSQGKRLCLPIPRKPGEAEQRTALWAWESHGGRKASQRPQGPLVSSSWPATFPGGAQSLRLQAAREARASGQGGPDYSIVWEELNLSISVSISASERRFWEQNHRKRKKPAREKVGQRETRRRDAGPHLESRDLLSGGELGFPKAQEKISESLPVGNQKGQSTEAGGPIVSKPEGASVQIRRKCPFLWTEGAPNQLGREGGAQFQPLTCPLDLKP